MNKHWTNTVKTVFLAGCMTAYATTAIYADTITNHVVISDYGPVGHADSTSVEEGSTSGVSVSGETASGNISSLETSETLPSETQSTGESLPGERATQGNLSGFHTTEKTKTPEVGSQYAILVNVDTNEIVATKNAEERFHPASMTKVMTLLVACEHIPDAAKKVTITQDIVDYVNENGASHVGFKAGEVVTVQDLLYGLILPSGADAALALTRLIAGSEEQFVTLMNQKAAALGISGTTHFSNTTGLYGEQHYSTPKDIAIIMDAASQNTLARTVLSTRNYTTTKNEKHTKGIALTNLFLTRIAEKPTGGVVNLAKTGYIAKAGNCSVSAFTASSGTHYIAVTGKAQGVWNCIGDHVTLYSTYAK